MKLKETEKIEFKKSTKLLKEAAVSISSILNKHGQGEIYFGLTDNGTPVKNDISTNTIRTVTQAISDKIEPKIFPEVEVVEINGIEVIKVIFAGFHPPYSAEGRYYIRVGDEDKKLSASELSSLIISHKDLRWDSEICKYADIRDIDIAKIKKFCAAAGIRFTSARDILQNLSLIKNDKLVNAALLLFSKDPEKTISNSKLQCSVFAGTSTSAIIDQKNFTGDIIFLIEEAEKYILKNIHVGMQVNGLYRKDIPETDTEAIREAVVNAFIHRDYFDPDFVSIHIFKDRIELRNPGGLFGGLTIKDIITRYISKRRNELLADVLNRAHLVERKGRGIALILEKEPASKFEQIGSVFISTLVRNNYILDEGLVDRLVEKLGENQGRIVKIIYETPRVSKKKLSEYLKISTTAVDKNLKKLKEKGIIERIGPDRGGYWKINTKLSQVK